MKSNMIHKLVIRLSRSKGILFHLTGIIFIIWFLIRVVHKPDRLNYPCQQLSISIAIGYLTFWSVLFYGLIKWIKTTEKKVSKALPTILVCILLMFTITIPVFSQQYSQKITTFTWTPIPKDPIGIPMGVNPGRVVWIWNPDATEIEQNGFWWEYQNNNQEVIDEMYSDGIKSLAGFDNEIEAWDSLFRYFNNVHGKGDISYQPGEKIAIKINMVYCFVNPYDFEEPRLNANPYVVKGLLNQLVNVIGIPQEDIILFDSSRNFFDWFYYRVYYKSYPSDPLIPEYPNISYVDAEGGAPGREKVIPSEELVYFADGSCEYRTLPTCITDADYLINMPICKRHFGDRVTLTGKNLFGTWVEDVVAVHPYHTIGYSAMGNPAPQTDLLAHEQLGKKTLLVVGDGLYSVRYDNAYASYFKMYPFNNDWMNSLFFSQDSVAIDSVMYDFLYTDGTGPGEGAQNYLHQAADPPTDVYDPEGDGIYISESLGVHEHWDSSFDIFSPERYSGIWGNGIDYIPIGLEHAAPSITIENPREKWLYVFGNDIYYMVKYPYSIIIGPIEVEAVVNGDIDEITMVEFYLDDILMDTIYGSPFIWKWNKTSFNNHILKVIGYTDEDILIDEIEVLKLL